MKPELVSFPLCPFVQRAAIVLLEKEVEFDITYIDLMDPPDWFLAISPMKKVPLLKLDNEVLFESAVICECLDELYPPSMHPEDIIQRAKNRAWIEFASHLFMLNFQVSMAKTAEEFAEKQQTLHDDLMKLEPHINRQGFFNGGEQFSIVDAAFAPLFVRMDFVRQHKEFEFSGEMPKVEAWAARLLARESVRNSIPANLAERYFKRFASQGAYFTQA